MDNTVPAPVESDDISPAIEPNEGSTPTLSDVQLRIAPNPTPGRRRAVRPPGVPIDSSKLLFWEEGQSLLAQLEVSLGCKVISLCVSSFAKLTQDEVPELFNHLHNLGKQPKLGLLLYGLGGSPIAAYRIVKLLRSYTDFLTVLIPDAAASAMTMLALGADQILMGPLSALSPIDTSIANHPLAPLDQANRPVTVEITQVRKYMELVNSDAYGNADDFRKTPFCALSDKVHPVFLGSIQRSLSLSRLLMKGIAETHIHDEEKVNAIVSSLNDDYPIHSYPILREDLVQLGFDVQEMTAEQNSLSMDYISYSHVRGRGTENVNDTQKTVTRTYATIESEGLRSYSFHRAEDRLVNQAWVRMKSDLTYQRAVVAKNKKGYYEVIPLTTKQFRLWLGGEEIEI